MMNNTLRAEGAAVTDAKWNAIKVAAMTRERDTNLMKGQSCGSAARAACLITLLWKAD